MVLCVVSKRKDDILVLSCRTCACVRTVLDCVKPKEGA